MKSQVASKFTIDGGKTLDMRRYTAGEIAFLHVLTRSGVIKLGMK